MSGTGSYQDRIEGRYRADGLAFALVVSGFHEQITEQLLQSAHACLVAHGAATEACEIVRVPGGWELPMACQVAAESGRFDAVLALGCVVQGETPHFDYICQEVARGLGHVARETRVPVMFGVLTTLTLEQAQERADPARHDKGREVALAALQLVHSLRSVRGSDS